MKLVYLEYFIQVVKSGSITKAANILYMKQSNLSKHIKYLEEYFGTQLFDRTFNGSKLTEDGLKVYLWASKFLEEKEELRISFSEKSLNKADREVISFYINPTINQTNHTNTLLSFSSQYPHIKINVFEKSIYSILTELNNNTNSLALTILDEHFVEYIKENTDFILLPFIESKFMLYTAHENSFLGNQKTISLTRLKNIPLLLYAPATAESSPIIEILSHYTSLNNIQTVSNNSMLHTMLQSGQYATIGFKFMKDMGKYKAISLREHIPLYSCFLLKNETLKKNSIATFLEFYYKNRNMPLPKALLNE